MSSRILITGAAGNIGSVGFKVVEFLRKKNHIVRAMVRKIDERSKALESLGAEIVVADFTDLTSLHKAVSGCSRVYFGMGVSDAYLEGALNMAAVAKHHNVELFVNMSQMSVAQMDIFHSSESKQQRYHWLVEQALNWSGLPVVHIRATIFLEHPFFTIFSAASIKESSKITLPFGEGKTSPVATIDVARVIATVMESPEDHKGKIYHLTGPKSQDMNGIAAEFSKALQCAITYEDVPLEQWQQESLKKAHLDAHVANHIATMAKLHREGFYDRCSDDVEKVTGQNATSVEEWVKLNASLFSISSSP